MGLIEQYQQRVDAGSIQDDEVQREVLARLQLLSDTLEAREMLMRNPISRLLKRFTPLPRGLYIWGNVGRGKSMVMDLFFAHAPVTKKRRIHFHAFMQEVHQRMHEHRKKGQDPVVALAAEIAAGAQLLCFDELQATDPADATLLFRLFDGLFARGVVVVSTSNRPVASLYTGGVQKERFAKFISLLEQHMHVFALSSATDYRYMQLQSLEKVYFWPLGAAANAALENAVDFVCDDAVAKADSLMVQGRKLDFVRYGKSMGAFSFAQLCAQAMGPADYLALAAGLDTVIVTGIPKLSAEMRNESKRFVTLIDVLYEQKVVLLCTADAAPEALYLEGDGHFEFQRTVSRLVEMQSKGYINQQLGH